MDQDRDREEILEDIDAINVALSAYRILIDESDEYVDDELEEELIAELAELELELKKFDKRYLN